MEKPGGRVAGCTEQAWCRAVPGGTGTGVLALSAASAPDIHRLQNALHKLQNSHPILKSRLHYSPISSSFSFITSPTPFVQLKIFKAPETLRILEDQNTPENQGISPFQLLLEHELNENSWRRVGGMHSGGDLLFASVYEVGGGKWVGVFRLHVAACDRTTAVAMLEELLILMKEEEERWSAAAERGEVGLGIEDLVPKKVGKKAMLTRGLDVLSYSVNSLRLTNLKFKDVKSGRRSQVVRLQIGEGETHRILAGCRSRGIKLSAALVAAGLLAAHGGGYGVQRHQRKYGILTLVDCRRILDPSLSSHHFGFYHSAILNSYSIKGGEDLWDLATKAQTTFETAKKNNKHFSDMSDLSFLMCKAIDNPGLTPSSSMRTSLMTVFEDTVIDDSGRVQAEIGLDDYMGCASVHGIGPSVAVFDTVRDGRLDCVCVYPAPLHSRAQMDGLIDRMKAILVKA